MNITKLPELNKSLVPVDWHYGIPAITLHWTLAVLIAGTAALGSYMTSIETELGSAKYFDIHKSIGIVITALVFLRVVWRLTHAPAKLPSSVASWQVRLAHITEALLFALMVVVPLTGYLGASYTKAGVQFFGVAIPTWAVPEQATAEQLLGIHSILVGVLLSLIALHVAGALVHAFWYKDTVFRRMWFAR